MLSEKEYRQIDVSLLAMAGYSINDIFHVPAELVLKLLAEYTQWAEAQKDGQERTR